MIGVTGFTENQINYAIAGWSTLSFKKECSTKKVSHSNCDSYLINKLLLSKYERCNEFLRLCFFSFPLRIPKEDVDEIVHFEHTENEVCTVIVTNP